MAAGIAAGSVALVLVAVLSVLTAAYFQKQERVQRGLVAEKEEQRNLARQSLYFAHIRVTHEDWQSGQITRVLNTLRQHIPAAGEPDLRGWEWYYLLSLCHREERTLRGHSNGVTSVSAHPHGRWFASGGGDGIVRIWDAESGHVMAELKGHEAEVMSVSWSQDGTKLASGGLDGKLILWDPRSFQKTFLLDCDREVWAVAWSPDGMRLAAGGLSHTSPPPADGLVTIWDVASGRRLHYLKGNDYVWSLAWHPSGRVLVSGGNIPSNLQVWDADTGQLLKTVEAHGEMIRALAWSPDGRRLASATYDQRIRIWNPDSWEMIREIDRAHGGELRTIAWSPDGTALVSGGRDRMVKLWDAQTGALLNVFRGHQGSVSSVCWWPQRGLLLSASGRADGTVKIWDPKSEQAAQAPLGCSPFAWSPDGRQIAVGGQRRSRTGREFSISVLDAATRQPLYQLHYATNATRYPPSCVAWNPDGRRLAVGFAGDLLQVWDLATRKEILTIAGTNDDQRPRSVAWSPDGRLLLTACYDGMARIWNAEARDRVLTFRGHAERPRNPSASEDHADGLSSACWHPDGRRIASKDFGGGVLIWEASTGRILHQLWCADSHSPGQGHQVMFSPRGDLLAAGSGDGAVMVWDVETGREIHVLRGHTTNVRGVSWSPDGRRLASASEDRTIRIWDTRSGQELLVLASPQNQNPSVAWSPDGRRVGTADGVVRIFDASLGYELGAKMTPGSGGD
jgi:WD40 repeat protein